MASSKMTLLAMVQNILSAMDSDEVNTVNDTKESAQVAEIIKETYYELFGNHSVPEKKSIVKLTGLGDTARPNYMLIPDNVLKVDWIKYKDGDTYKEVTYCDPEVFIERALLLNSGTNTVSTLDPDGAISYYIKNNIAPTYYTSFDDQHIAFDSYDAAADTTLHQNKSAAWGSIDAAWTVSDAFVPDLDANLFPLFLAEAKSVSFVNIKQTANSKEEQRARRQYVKMQYTRHKLNSQEEARYSKGNNYARRR